MSVDELFCDVSLQLLGLLDQRIQMLIKGLQLVRTEQFLVRHFGRKDIPVSAAGTNELQPEPCVRIR